VFDRFSFGEANKKRETNPGFMLYHLALEWPLDVMVLAIPKVDLPDG
tara:strand:+ start:556 stop:696 length:141 start_codon:yes stop_codon:yes gene_type:complete